jgi:Cu(I)/Ag(I) efflux system membrane fusion protein
VVSLTGTLSATPWTAEEQAALSDAGNADAKLNLAKANYARVSKLASEGIVARQDLDASRSELEQAQSAAQQADAKRENMGLTGSEKDIAPLSKIWGLAALPESELGEAAVGQAVSVETSAFPGQKFAGKVIAVSRSAEAETRQFTVRIAIADPSGKLHSQMLATFAITVPAGPGLSIPSPAVLLEPDGAYVYVASGRTFRRRAIRIGASGGSRTQVLAGLAAGESVVVQGAQLLESERLKSQIKTEDSD